VPFRIFCLKYLILQIWNSKRPMNLEKNVRKDFGFSSVQVLTLNTNYVTNYIPMYVRPITQVTIVCTFCCYLKHIIISFLLNLDFFYFFLALFYFFLISFHPTFLLSLLLPSVFHGSFHYIFILRFSVIFPMSDRNILYQINSGKKYYSHMTIK
jgi:hypothetical protein